MFFADRLLIERVSVLNKLTTWLFLVTIVYDLELFVLFCEMDFGNRKGLRLYLTDLLFMPTGERSIEVGKLGTLNDFVLNCGAPVGCLNLLV
jgi:hypothetical protein